MKTKIAFVLMAATVIAACSTTKKSTTTTTPASPTPVAATKPADGIYAPGNEELTAIRAQYNDATLAQLNEGYAIYNTGVCTGCHGAKNIYKRPTAEWKAIMDDMAQRAQISAAQKQAVYRYVLAIKATQAQVSK